MEKYKIGMVARLLDLPNDTLRYYESRGLVTPQKDEENGYRYYDAWDLNYLLDSLHYRSFDFSLNDVVKMINEDDHEEIVERCLKRESELLHTIYEYKQKLNSLVMFRQRMSQLIKKVGVYEVTERPAMVYQRHRVNNEFVFEEDSLSVMKKWLAMMPKTDHTFVVPNYNVSNPNSFNEYWWGFSLSPDDAMCSGIDISPPVEYYPPTKCIYTVFTAGGRSTFTNSLKTKVISDIQRMGHKIIGPPIGHLIVRLHEDGVFTRYFQVWVPI